MNDKMKLEMLKERAQDSASITVRGPMNFPGVRDPAADEDGFYTYMCGYLEGSYFSLLRAILGDAEASKVEEEFEANFKSMQYAIRNRPRKPSEPTAPPLCCDACGSTDGPFIKGVSKTWCEDCVSGPLPADRPKIVREGFSPSAAKIQELH